MAEYRLTIFARHQVAQTLADSEIKFGPKARLRYSTLLKAAFHDVADQPDRLGIAWRTVRWQDVGVYHIRHSRTRVSDPPGRVAAPRHFVVFRIAEDGVIDILGLMHDRMLPDRALRVIVRANQSEE